MSDPTSAPPPPAPRRRLWLWAALFVSVGLNIAVAGIVLGAVLQNREGDRRLPPAAMAQDLGLGPYVRALEPRQRLALGRSVGQRIREDGRPTDRATRRRNFAEVLDALRAEPFEPERLAAALGAQAAAAEARRDLGQSALVEYLGTLPPEARTAYADRLEETFRRPRASHRPKHRRE